MKKILLLLSGLTLLSPSIQAEAVRVAFSPDGGA